MDHQPLARNLRAWRERVRPEAAGLPSTPRRRTPGLRREELACLAGVSTEYIVRLEQGRAAHPSPQVLSAIARALRLSATETGHLFHLAGVTPPDDKLAPRHITPGVMRIVDRLTDSAAVVVCTSAWETIYWNRLWAALLGDPASARGRERNFAWRHFTGLPTHLSHTTDALAEFEHDMVCDLRRTLDRYPAERDLAQMCQALQERDEHFARLWDSGDVARHRAVRKTVNHPLVGPITVDCDVLAAPDTELYVVVFTAEPGSEDASRLDLLRVMGTQSFASADLFVAGQRGEHVGEDGVGPGVQFVVGQQLDRMRDVDHAGAWHAESACLLDGFVGERCRRDADRRDAPALEVNQVMQTARRA